MRKHTFSAVAASGIWVKSCLIGFGAAACVEGGTASPMSTEGLAGGDGPRTTLPGGRDPGSEAVGLPSTDPNTDPSSAADELPIGESPDDETAVQLPETPNEPGEALPDGEAEEKVKPLPSGESLIDPNATAELPKGDDDPAGSQGLPGPDGTVPGDGSASPLLGGWVSATVAPAWTVQSLGFYPTELPLAPSALTDPTELPTWTTGRRMAIHGASLLVCVPEHGTLVELDRESGQVIRSIAVGGRPEQVVVGPDGTAFVTLRQSGMIARIDPGAATVSATAIAGTEPFGLALSIAADRLYVSASADDSLVVLSVPDLETLAVIPVTFRPRTVAVGLDGEVIVSGERGTASVVKADVASPPIALRVQNPGDLTIHKKLLPNIPGIASRAFGVAIHPVTGSAYLSHQITRSGTPESESSKLDPANTPTGSVCKPPTFCPNPGGYGSATCNPVCEQVNLVFPRTRRPLEMTVTWVPKEQNSANAVMPALPVQHGPSGEPMTAICDKPMDAIHHPSLSLMFVACEGTDNVVVLNTAAGDPMTAVLGEIRVGAAPRAIVLSPDGMTAYVANAQAFSVGRFDVAAFTSALVETNFPSSTSDNFFPLTFPQGQTVASATVNMAVETHYAVDPITNASERMGRRAYTYARFEGLSANGFFACATCHIEGGDDGLTWFVVDGPRQTPMLAQRLSGTEPFNWNGTAPTLPLNIHNTVSRMGGTGIEQGVAEGISAYLIGKNGPVAPQNKHISATGLTAAQKAGQALYFNPIVGCATCHTGAPLTDAKNWDVGTFSQLEMDLREKNQSDAPLELNTPSLRGLYYSAPFFHDGSAPTLYDVLASTSTTMGHSFMLTKIQQDQLVAYLLTL